jgi:superfamily II DNA or RNA helicase
MITIYVGNAKCKMVGLSDERIIAELDKLMSYSVQSYQFMRQNTGWDGRYRLFNKKSGLFPVGLLSIAESILKVQKLPYQIQDTRSAVTATKSLSIDPNSVFIPRDYQVAAVDAAIKAGSGVLRAATGAGKSLIIAMIAGHYNVKSIIYVIGKELLYQMKDTLEAALGVEVGIVGDGKCDIVDGINICTIWSAAAAFNKKAKILDNDNTKGKKIKKEKNLAIRALVQEAELFFVDECQYAAAETVQFLHRESLAARHRFLLSGTPWREAGDDILIEAVGGPKFYDITATELIDKGWLVRPYITFVDIPTMRGVGKTYHEVYNNFIVNNDYRNSKIAESTKKMVDGNRKVLILVTKVNHGDVIREFLDPALRVDNLNGSNSTADRMRAIQEMKNGDLDVLIASSIFDQGIDIPELDALVLAGSGKSTARALQRIGRVIRRKNGKENAVVLDFKDNCKYLREHSQARYKIYSTEPGFKIKRG